MDNQQIKRLKNTVWDALKSANFDITKASENTSDLQTSAIFRGLKKMGVDKPFDKKDLEKSVDYKIAEFSFSESYGMLGLPDMLRIKNTRQLIKECKSAIKIMQNSGKDTQGITHSYERMLRRYSRK
jgi:predicted secreted protein